MPQSYAFGVRLQQQEVRELQQQEVRESARETPTLHAFTMLGTRTLFLCHLTMFHMEEHLYQLVLEAELPDHAMRRFQEEREEFPRMTYFLGNSGHDVMTVPQIQSGARRVFIGDVFRGIPDKPQYTSWPWADETPVIGNVTVSIRRVVYYRHLAFSLVYPTALTYVLFGAEDEAHMTNYQTPGKDGDFDHVLSLETAPDWLSPHQLRAGVHVTLEDVSRKPGEGRVHCVNPLPPGKYSVQYRGRSAPQALAIGHTHWFCTRIANHQDPCSGEAFSGRKRRDGDLP